MKITDICIGDIIEYNFKLYVIVGVFCDGVIYLQDPNEEFSNTIEASIKDIKTVPITKDSLERIGFNAVNDKVMAKTIDGNTICISEDETESMVNLTKNNSYVHIKSSYTLLKKDNEEKNLLHLLQRNVLQLIDSF